jgi:ribosomal protein S27AE
VGEPDRAPDLRDVYAFVNAGWRRHAVCAEEDDVNFWPDENLQRYTRHLGSAVALLPLLICEACPVRVDCLREGLTRFPAPMQDAETSSGRGAPVRLDVRSVGVWGGSMDVDRFHVAHLPPEAAIAELERTFPKRLAKRIRAFPRADRGGVGNRTVRRVRAILAARRPAAHTRPRCARCGTVLPALSRSDRRFCGRCQVASYRARAA